MPIGFCVVRDLIVPSVLPTERTAVLIKTVGTSIIGTFSLSSN